MYIESFNQSMSDKNETQYRKTGRSKSSNQQHRGFSPAYPTGAGAGGPAPSISSNRSFKKSNNNEQGGQSRANVTTVNPSDAGASETTVTFTLPKQTEPYDDWKDAADISTPKLGTSDSGEQACGDKDGSGHGAKKYSRDFLLKFSMQFLDRPEGIEMMSDIAEILNANVNASPSVDYDSLPSPGRIIDRPRGAARLDRRGIGMIDDDRWSKGGNVNFRPEMSSNPGDPRRMTAGLNGFSSLSERGTYNPREDPIPRLVPDRFGGPAAYDQSSAAERNMNFGGRDPRSSDRTPPPTRAQGAALTQNVPSEKSEERLRDMSLGVIKEFYSARDENEVALCIKDLNSPSFHPSMISLWVTDSFERKDAERDLLAKLLVNLTKSQDGTLSQSQLIKGFETVLSTLEDAVNDAPRAPEFLGLIFARVILENVVSLNQIGQLIYEGGEEPGHLLEVGLAGNVLGNVLEIIKSEKGESVLDEICTSSNLRLETFRPPDPHKSRILEKFI